MRLEHFCRIIMQYTGDSRWHSPYQRRDGQEGEQELGYGTGDGTVTGELLEGTLTWVNTTERREDGDWPGPWRSIIGHAGLITEHPPLRWLSTRWLVGEGEINARILRWWFDAYVCVNDAVEYPPAIGIPAPDRFRQGGASSTTVPA
jgi:hypothetical protein